VGTELLKMASAPNVPVHKLLVVSYLLGQWPDPPKCPVDHLPLPDETLLSASWLSTCLEKMQTSIFPS
jgi:hypothetical protein